ncbi:hypothetical protein PtB15_7B97 [Puccinia triticina]|nr:hypothetical protein PtB15_7B97 [Puccinia triticina]
MDCDLTGPHKKRFEFAQRENSSRITRPSALEIINPTVPLLAPAAGDITVVASPPTTRQPSPPIASTSAGLQPTPNTKELPDSHERANPCIHAHQRKYFRHQNEQHKSKQMSNKSPATTA